MTLRYFGRAGMAARIREHMVLAREFAGWVDEASGWKRLAPVGFSVVVFAFNPKASRMQQRTHSTSGFWTP